MSEPATSKPPPSERLPRTEKLRLDKLLVDRGLAASRERAQALILAGRVLVEEQKVQKPGTPVAPGAALRLLGDDLRYVSRGGLKLEGALAAWGIDVNSRVCADIGASTGGFTDCLLQHGAASVLAVDTGYGQIAHKLRVDPRVTLLERTNARTLAPGSLSPGCLAQTVHPATQQKHPPLAPAADLPAPISFFAIDVSFIGVSLVLPPLLAALTPAAASLAPAEGAVWRGEAVILVKPQFEAGREHVGKGGIVRDPQAHQLAIDRVATAVRELKGEVLATIDSPILGMEGNKEFLLHTRF